MTAYDAPIYIADAALYLTAAEPDLGITDPYELTQEQFDAAIELLKEQNANIGEYWTDYAKEVQAFTNGDLVVGTAWPYQALLLQGEGEPVDFNEVPDEGATGWSDTWMLTEDAEHPNCMVRVDEPRHQPRGPGEGRGVVRRGAGQSQGLRSHRQARPCLLRHGRPLRALPRRRRGRSGSQIEFWRTPVSDCGEGREDEECVTFDDWIQGWTEVKG